MKIVAISDTHDQHRQIKIPNCDLLIVAGDFTSRRDPSIADYVEFNDWLHSQPAERIIVVAGNHDTLFEKRNEFAREILTNATYLEDSGTKIGGLNFWGSPWTPFFNHWAFMKPDEFLHEYWNEIPDFTDVLITHGPPWGVLDVNTDGENCGSFSLKEKLETLKPKAHIFGHIHESKGKKDNSYNVSVCDANYNPVNGVTIIEL